MAGEAFYGEGDSGIAYNDPDLGIAWPMELIGGEEKRIISEKDLHLMSFKEYTEKLGKSDEAGACCGQINTGAKHLRFEKS
jgi:hypothetical protein